jgi:hypothetical protein
MSTRKIATDEKITINRFPFDRGGALKAHCRKLGDMIYLEIMYNKLYMFFSRYLLPMQNGKLSV